MRQTQRWLIAATAGIAFAGVVATEALNASTREQPVDLRGRAERSEPVQSPSPSCSWMNAAGTEATAHALPGDREFRVVGVDSVCSGSRH
jgi:hypothetical protein